MAIPREESIESPLSIELRLCSIKSHYKTIPVDKPTGKIIIPKEDLFCEKCKRKEVVESAKKGGFIIEIEEDKFWLLKCSFGHRHILQLDHAKTPVECPLCDLKKNNEAKGISLNPYALRGVKVNNNSFLRFYCKKCGKDHVARENEIGKITRHSHRCEGGNVNPFIYMLAVVEIYLDGINFDDWTTDLKHIKLFGTFPPEFYDPVCRFAIVNMKFHSEKYLEPLQEVCKANDIALIVVGNLPKEKTHTSIIVNEFLKSLEQHGLMNVDNNERGKLMTRIIVELEKRKESGQLIQSQKQISSTPEKPNPSPAKNKGRSTKKKAIYHRSKGASGNKDQQEG